MKKVFLLLIFCYVSVAAQDLRFYGEFKSGSLVIGQSDGVQWAKLDGKDLQVDENGIFAFGFDRDDNEEHLLNIKLESNKVILKRITLGKRKYRIQRINKMKKSLVTAPKSQNERLARERKISKEARKKIGEIDTALFADGFMCPVNGGWISSVFGSQRILNGTPKNAHNGIDIAAAKGTPVYAMADGFVTLAADTFYYAGNYILVDHGQGVNSFYLHLSKKDVKAGDFVKKGDKIGEIGSTGRSTGPHLHWGCQWYGKRVDPKGILEMNFKLKRE